MTRLAAHCSTCCGRSPSLNSPCQLLTVEALWTPTLRLRPHRLGQEHLRTVEVFDLGRPVSKLLGVFFGGGFMVTRSPPPHPPLPYHQHLAANTHQQSLLSRTFWVRALRVPSTHSAWWNCLEYVPAVQVPLRRFLKVFTQQLRGC